MKLANAVYVFALSVGVIAQQKTLKIDGAAINADIDTGIMTIGYFDCMIMEDHLPFQLELKAEDFEMMDGLSFLPVSYIISPIGCFCFLACLLFSKNLKLDYSSLF